MKIGQNDLNERSDLVREETEIEDLYEKGDFAWAPAGRENKKKIVRVTDVAYLQPEEAPFPLEKTKKLIRRLPPEDYEEVCRGLERLLRCLKSRAKAMESN